MAIRILSIDGGGILGLLPAMVIAHLEKKLSGPLGDHFHLIAGTSTGGLLAVGLAANGPDDKPISGEDLVALYRDRGGRIFRRSAWKAITSLGGVSEEKYDHKSLEQELRATLTSDQTLSDLRNDTLVAAYEIEREDDTVARGENGKDLRGPFFFKSWKAQGTDIDPDERKEDLDFPLWQVCRATSAAPTFFEPAAVTSAGRQTHYLIDGGVFANNPAMCAYASALKLGGPGQEVMVVSLGTGDLDRIIPYDKAKDWGAIGWIKPVISVMMDGSEDSVTYQLQQMLGASFHRYQPSLGPWKDGREGPSDDMDDASPENIGRLVERGKHFIRKKKTELDRLAAALAQPMDPKPW